MVAIVYWYVFGLVGYVKVVGGGSGTGEEEEVCLTLVLFARLGLQV